MFASRAVTALINSSAKDESDRRLFLQTAAAAGIGVVGVEALGGARPADAAEISDQTILNFALNLEYVEAEFYSRSVFGRPLPASLTSGTGHEGTVTGGRQVTFRTAALRSQAEEIANDELDHVRFLRKTLGSAAIARPSLDLSTSFTKVARAGGYVGPNETFDPFAGENGFMLAGLLFEDNGVTAYKGAAPLIHNKTYLEASAGILAVEAYHAAILRTNLFQRGLSGAVNAFSSAKDSVDGRSDDDQGLGGKRGNLVPADKNSIAFGRTADRVLNVVYLTPRQVTRGGFFPEGVNGSIRRSGANG